MHECEEYQIKTYIKSFHITQIIIFIYHQHVVKATKKTQTPVSTNETDLGPRDVVNNSLNHVPLPDDSVYK